MENRETFVQIHKRLLRQLLQEFSVTWIVFPITGNFPVQVSTGKPVIENGDRDNNQSWAKWLKAQMVSQFSVLNFWILEETIGWNSNTLPEGVYLKDLEESRSLRFQRNAERKITGRKAREEDWWTVKPKPKVAKTQWQRWKCMTIG